MKRFLCGLAAIALAWALCSGLLLLRMGESEVAVLDPEGVLRLADLAADYGAALAGKAATPDSRKLADEARFVDSRRALAYSYKAFAGELKLRWLLSYFAVSLFLLGLFLAVGALLLRRSLRAARFTEEALRSWSDGRPIPSLPPRPSAEEATLYAALVEALRSAGDRERRERAAASVGEWREQGRFIVHEIKNRLTPLRLDAETLGGLGEALPERYRAALERMEANLDRLDAIVVAYRSLSGLPEPEYRKVDPASIARAAVERAGGSGRAEVSGSSAAEVVADERYLDIICTNLVRNALESSPSAQLRVGWDGMVLSFVDDGPGMDAVCRGRAFEFGFTTKEGGSGMGLAIVAGLCRAMGFGISLDSATGEGTAIAIDFGRNA